MSRFITLFAFALILVFPCYLWATPSIGNTSGTWAHGNSVTITSGGTDFGSKSPAAPRLWDACDAESTSDIDTYYEGQDYPDPGGPCGSPGETPYKMDYRSSFHGETSLPHSRVTKFLCSAHTTCNGDWDDPNLSTRGNATFTMNDWDALMVYTIFYHRVNSSYSQCTSGDADNYKEFSANGDDGSYLSVANGGSQSYIGSCQTPYLGYNEDNGGAETEATDYYWGTNGGSCATDDRVYMPNPMTGWIHYEFEYNATGRHVTMTNGSRVSTTHGKTIWSHRDFDNCINSTGTVPSISWGGFARGPRASATGNYRFWTAIYADDTWSRVMLGNDPTYSSCTIIEPQIPSAWSTSSITVTVNQGALEDGTAYLFVFDSNNDANSEGYPVTLGGSTPQITGITIRGGTIQ